MTAPAITADGLSKRYRIGTRGAGGYRTLREAIAGGVEATWRGLGRLGRARRREGGRDRPGTIWALRDVSFEIRRGEVVGIIGRNGAGKSTLLKVLSRITEPTSGRVVLRGSVGSLLEVGTGFHPELTGRENIYLNGAILGMGRRQVARKFDEIAAFAEIEPFLDTPVKRYSSGMYVRLAYAVAAHLNPDILMIDEVLSVGDLQFQRKCMDHAKRLREGDATVLFVSHNTFAIKAICSRVIYLAQGRARFDGPAEEGIRLYEEENRLETAPWAQKVVGSDPTSGPIYMDRMELLDESGRPRSVFDHGERMRVRLHVRVVRPVARPNFVVSFVRSDNVPCCNYSAAMDGLDLPCVERDGVVELLTPPLKLVSEHYTTQVLVWDDAFRKLHSAQTGATFHVRHDLLSTHFGVFHEPADWAWEPRETYPAGRNGHAGPGPDGRA